MIAQLPVPGVACPVPEPNWSTRRLFLPPGGTAEVFWRTDEGRELSIYTHEWADGIRGKRDLDWRLSLAARRALEMLE